MSNHSEEQAAQPTSPLVSEAPPSGWQHKVVIATHKIEADPNDATAYCQRGYAYRRLQMYDAALADYTHAITLAPASIAATIGWSAAYTCNFGLLQHQAAQYDAAIASFSNALALDPADPTPYTLRAASHFARHDYPATCADLTAALALDPTDEHTQHLIATYCATNPQFTSIYRQHSTNL